MILWTALWLAWAGEVVAGVMKRFRAGRALEARIGAMVPRLARFVGAILLVEALVLCGQAGFLVHKRFATRARKVRALIGPAIRRLLRARSLSERIARLAHVMNHRGGIVARLARRIARGLTQSHIAPPRAPIVLAMPAPAFALDAADTS